MFPNPINLICRGAIFTSLALLLCHCSTISNDRALLSAAGFREKMPTTPRQKELYAATPEYKVERINVNGHVLYAYKDTERGVAYVGGESEYSKYQQLAIKQQIAQDHLQAAQMQQNLAMGWYGAYGPFYYGSRRFLY